MKAFTCREFHEVVDAAMVGDRKPARRFYWRSFWWGFTHPFESASPLRDRLVDHRLGICDCTK